MSRCLEQSVKQPTWKQIIAILYTFASSSSGLVSLLDVDFDLCARRKCSRVVDDTPPPSSFASALRAQNLERAGRAASMSEVNCTGSDSAPRAAIYLLYFIALTLTSHCALLDC